MTPIHAGIRTRRELKSIKGYDRKLVRLLFDLDWKYSIDINGAMGSFGSKSAAFTAWKRAFNSIS